jgi:uncharacterized membrane protein
LTGFLVLILFIIAAYTHGRVRKLRREVNELRSENRHLETLTARVFALERAIGQQAPTLVAEPLPAVHAATTAQLPVLTAEPEPEPVVALHAPPIPIEPPQPEPEPLPPPEPVPAGPTWSERMREKVGSQEWEAMVGGNWLNKLGVLILIIGIALLLGFSFTKVGPAGRVAIAVAVSGAMLAAGAFVERGTPSKRRASSTARGSHPSCSRRSPPA